MQGTITPPNAEHATPEERRRRRTRRSARKKPLSGWRLRAYAASARPEWPEPAQSLLSLPQFRSPCPHHFPEWNPCAIFSRTRSQFLQLSISTVLSKNWLGHPIPPFSFLTIPGIMVARCELTFQQS